MILVAISWIYILLTVVPLGLATAKLFNIGGRKLPEISFLGLFTTAILASFWAFFGRINIEFQIFHLAICSLSFFRNRSETIAVFKEILQRISNFQLLLKIIFWPIILIILAQSSAAPFVLDNESYYIQTVKWLNEYGFVKGLANLHMLFGQFSGWHIAQSVFSFSFLYGNFNDLSGLCLLLGNVYAFYRLDDYCKTGNRIALIAGLLPLLNVFLLRFTGAPSPDIPVYIITFIIADRFIVSFKKPDRSHFNLIFLLTLFVLYCKTSAVLLALLSFYLLFTGGRKAIGWKTIASALVVFGLFIAKNSILTGYPLHPFPDFSIGSDYDLPRKIADLYYIETKIYGFELDRAGYKAANWLDLLVRWATLPQLHGLFNRFTILLLIVVPFFIRRSENRKALWLIYFTMILQLVLLLFGSPQYRYYINFSLFFALFCLAYLPLNKKIWLAGIGMSAIISLVLLLFPFSLNSFTRNENTMQTQTFSAENIVFPYRNSKLDVSYQTVRKGNLEYNSPVNSPFFWGTGDGNLPCVNTAQMEYIEEHYGTYPQLRTGNFKDGFYSKEK